VAQQDGGLVGAGSQQQLQQQASSSSAVKQQQGEEEGCEYECLKLDHGALLAIVQQWIATGSTCNHIAAAGYAPLPMQQQLLATGKALQDKASDTPAILAAAQQLHGTGLALCSFAVPCMCNNPGCQSVAGVSELAAVSGRSCICAGCRVARYCGRACQRAAWQQHKHVCGALSEAAAATAATATGAAGPATGVK
jgi:hypothetical protein